MAMSNQTISSAAHLLSHTISLFDREIAGCIVTIILYKVSKNNVQMYLIRMRKISSSFKRLLRAICRIFGTKKVSMKFSRDLQTRRLISVQNKKMKFFQQQTFNTRTMSKYSLMLASYQILSSKQKVTYGMNLNRWPCLLKSTITKETH